MDPIKINSIIEMLIFAVLGIGVVNSYYMLYELYEEKIERDIFEEENKEEKKEEEKEKICSLYS